MPNQTPHRSPWQRALLEASVIVGSILLAFAIDAAWDGRQERELDRAYLTTVRSDLVASRGLLQDAIALHERTVEVGRILLVGEWDATSAWDTVKVLLGATIPSYVINAPLGGIAAASNSGSVGRLADAKLREDLTRWPGYVEDLLEEELAGDRFAVERWRPYLATVVPLEEVYATTDGIVSGGAASSAVAPLELPRPEGPVALDALLRGMEFRNHLLDVVYNARASATEALYFAGILDEILADLEAELQR